MKTLVIHPTDSTTKFLSVIYKDKDWTIINDGISKEDLFALIADHKRIIFMGHGIAGGMLGFPYLIDERFFTDKTKLYVCIWCNADQFVKKYKIKGFHTGMIISEMEEANYMGIFHANYTQLEESNSLFAGSIAAFIDYPDDTIVDCILKTYDSLDNPIIEYNRQRIYQK
jgi:hypothetical protein